MKEEYNKLLARYYKAEAYFNRQDIGNAEKERHLKDFEKILTGLNYYLKEIGEYSKINVLEGF